MTKRYYQVLRRGQGLTLIELMMGLALLGILLSWGVPNFKTLHDKNLLRTRSDLLLNHLHLTRAESIKRNLPVVICRSQDHVTCFPGNTASTDWGMGWMIFVDVNSNRVRDTDEPILRVATAVSNQVSIRFNQWWRLTFSPDGGAGNGSFILCNDSGQTQIIVIYRSGRTRQTKTHTSGNECPFS